MHISIALTSKSVQYDGGGSHGLLNVVTQDTALKGRAKRPFLLVHPPEGRCRCATPCDYNFCRRELHDPASVANRGAP